MSAEAVWRTTTPEVVALWDQWRAEQERWERTVTEFVKRHDATGERAPIVTNSVFGGQRLVGMQHLPGHEVPTGWRLDKRHHVLVPARSKREGKALAAEIDGIPSFNPRQDVPGMPSWSLGAGFVASFGAERHGDALYVVRSTDSIAEEVDGGIWERVKLSEYHAVREAGVAV